MQNPTNAQDPDTTFAWIKTLYIATHADRSSLLNKRNELVSKCRNKNKFSISKKKQEKTRTWTPIT